MDVSLNDEQNEEMKSFVAKISEVGDKELQSVLAEGEKYASGVGETMKAIWANDL